MRKTLRQKVSRGVGYSEAITSVPESLGESRVRGNMV